MLVSLPVGVECRSTCLCRCCRCMFNAFKDPEQGEAPLMDNNYLKRKDLQFNGCDCRVWLMKHTVKGKARQMIAGERHTPAKDSTSKLSPIPDHNNHHRLLQSVHNNLIDTQVHTAHISIPPIHQSLCLDVLSLVFLVSQQLVEAITSTLPVETPRWPRRRLNVSSHTDGHLSLAVD